MQPTKEIILRLEKLFHHGLLTDHEKERLMREYSEKGPTPAVKEEFEKVLRSEVLILEKEISSLDKELKDIKKKKEQILKGLVKGFVDKSKKDEKEIVGNFQKFKIEEERESIRYKNEIRALDRKLEENHQEALKKIEKIGIQRIRQNIK